MARVVIDVAEVAERDRHVIRQKNPGVGPLRFAYELLGIDRDDQNVVTFLPADAATSDAVDRPLAPGREQDDVARRGLRVISCPSGPNTGDTSGPPVNAPRRRGDPPRSTSTIDASSAALRVPASELPPKRGTRGEERDAVGPVGPGGRGSGGPRARRSGRREDAAGPRWPRGGVAGGPLVVGAAHRAAGRSAARRRPSRWDPATPTTSPVTWGHRTTAPRGGALQEDERATGHLHQLLRRAGGRGRARLPRARPAQIVGNGAAQQVGQRRPVGVPRAVRAGDRRPLPPVAGPTGLGTVPVHAGPVSGRHARRERWAGGRTGAATPHLVAAPGAGAAPQRGR